MDSTKELPTVLSFCSGYAGIERGLELAGLEHRVLAYVEIETYAIANLVAKMESGQLAPAPVWTNLKTFPAHLFRGHVDLITGGYPCQPFSAAGNRKGGDDPRHLWPFISHAIGIINPRRVFFENVEGHVSLGLSTVLADLEDRGFDTTWGVFSAAEVGAPHRRKRVFIMADSPRQQPQFTSAGRKGREDTERGGSDCRGSESAREISTMADSLSVRESQSEGSISDKWGRAIYGGETSTVADSSGEGLQGGGQTGDIGCEGTQSDDEQLAGRDTAQRTIWPATSGEQHRWEEPRVMRRT